MNTLRAAEKKYASNDMTTAGDRCMAIAIR